MNTMKAAGVLVLAAALLTGCDTGDGDRDCHEKRAAGTAPVVLAKGGSGGGGSKGGGGGSKSGGGKGGFTKPKSGSGVKPKSGGGGDEPQSTVGGTGGGRTHCRTEKGERS